jgi:hypothetical protein
MKKLFDFDPQTLTTKTFHYDESVDAKNFIIETVQDATPIIEANKARLNQTHAKIGSGKEDFVRVASIPMNLYMELRQKGIAQDPAAMKRWLNDPDNKYFRTRAGVI